MPASSRGYQAFPVVSQPFAVGGKDPIRRTQLASWNLQILETANLVP